MLYAQRSFFHICMEKEREDNYLHIIVLYVVCTKVFCSYLYSDDAKIINPNDRPEGELTQVIQSLARM